MSINGVNGISRTVGSIAAVTLALCLFAYSFALQGPLFFDDVPNLLANDFVQIDGGDFDDWRVAALSSNAGQFSRPLAMLSFALNHAASGSFSVFGLKATNLAIHLLIGVLVYFFTLALLATPALRTRGWEVQQCQLVAVIAGAIWLLHPIHVSTVLYAIQRMAQLSTLFTLAGLLVFTRYRLRWAEVGAGPGEILAAFLWILLLGFFAVLSKENGALLPWLIAVTEVILFRGIWRGKPQPALVRLGWVALLLPLLLLLLVVIISPELLSGRFAGREFTLQDRVLTQGRVLWRYLGWLLVPNILDMGFFHDDIAISRSLWSPLSTIPSLIGWAAVIGASLLGHRKYPLVAFALLFYLLAHSMESSVLPLEMVFEHRNYLPSVGIAVLGAVGIFHCVTKFDRLRLRVALGGVLGLFVVLLAVRTNAWSDEMTLARFNVINHPDSARANFFYANALFKRVEQAEERALDQEEVRSLVVASRTYFARMHDINAREFAPLVMLHQLDTMYFPGLVDENDWLGKMEVLAETRRWQSSDRTALNALVEFSLTPAGKAGRERVGSLLAYLTERYPWRMDLLADNYRFLRAADDAESDALLAVLVRADQLNPNSRQAAAYLAQYHGTDNLASTYEAIREWMRRDHYRREIGTIREIFEN